MTGNFRQVDPARGANLRVHQWRLSDPKMYVSANQMYGAKADVGRQIAASLRGVGNNIRQDRLLEQAQARQDQLRQESQNRQDTIRAEQNQRQDAREERRHQLKQGRIQNVGGRLVHVDKDGMPKVIYSPPSSNIDQRLKEAKLKNLQEGDPLKQAKVNILKQLMPQAVQPQSSPPAQPQVQLQSNEVTTTDPNLIQAQTAQQAPAAPAQPQASPGVFDGLTPDQKKGTALNIIQNGLGTPLLNNQKSENYNKPALNVLETKILNAEEHYSRVKDIAKQFNPEFLTFGGVLKGTWYKLRDKAAIGQLALDPQQTQYLQKFATFRQSSARNINLYIKEITGAQMSEKEADRIMLGEAVAGTGFLDGDSPTTFKAKLDNSLRLIRLSRMRYHYLRSGGFRGTAMSPEDIASAMEAKRPPISLPQMRGLYNKRHAQNLKALRQSNPSINKQQLDAQAIARTNREFGI